MTENEFENLTAEFREEFQKKLEHDGMLYAGDIKRMVCQYILSEDFLVDTKADRYCGMIYKEDEE